MSSTTIHTCTYLIGHAIENRRYHAREAIGVESQPNCKIGKVTITMSSSRSSKHIMKTSNASQKGENGHATTSQLGTLLNLLSIPTSVGMLPPILLPKRYNESVHWKKNNSSEPTTSKSHARSSDTCVQSSNAAQDRKLLVPQSPCRALQTMPHCHSPKLESKPSSLGIVPRMSFQARSKKTVPNGERNKKESGNY